MPIVTPYLSVITLNINGLNSPMKKHRVAEWIKKKPKKQKNQDLTICCPQRLTSALRTHKDQK